MPQWTPESVRGQTARGIREGNPVGTSQKILKGLLRRINVGDSKTTDWEFPMKVLKKFLNESLAKTLIVWIPGGFSEVVPGDIDIYWLLLAFMC